MSHASRLVTLISLALVATAAIGRASAGTPATWVGGGGSLLWSTATNWAPAPPTTSGAYDLVFSGTLSGTAQLNNDIGTITVSSLTFANSGSLTSSGTFNLFNLAGSGLALSSGTITTTAAVNASAFDGDTVAMPLSLSGSNAIALGTGHSLSISGNISGGGSLTISGGVSNSSFVYLSGSSSYSGGTVITGGNVQTQSRTSTVGDNFTLGTGPVSVSGSGTLYLRNSSTLGNTLSLSGTGALGGALRGSFGTAGSTAATTGTVALTGDAGIATASSVNGDTTSKLVMAGPLDLGSFTATFRPGKQATAATGLLIDVQGSITGAGSVILNAPTSVGPLKLSGSNNYTGSTTITSGTLIVGNSNALGNGAALAVNANGLDLNGFTVSSGALSGSATGVIQSNTSGAARLITSSTASSTYAGTITNGSGTVGLTKAGSGTLTLTGSNGFTGSAAINGGVLALGGSNVLAGGGDITFGSGTMQYSAANTLDYSTRITNSSAAVAIDTNGQTITYAGAIPSSNVAGLTKSGSGALYLNAVNQFTGTTTVVSGTLGGNGRVTGPVVVSGSSVIAPGATANSFGTFGLGGLAVTAAEATVMMSISGTTAGTTYDQFDFSAGSTVTYGGKLDLSLSGSYANGTAFDLFKGFASASGHFSTLTFAAAGSPYDNLAFNQIGTSGIWQTGNTAGGQYLVFNEGTGQLVVVPEPSSLVLVAMAAGTLAFGSRRRRRAV
ncbi:MAG: autotransporter-associated beta strand repeat-containing protein [Planctomycetes bacterium]|nr:autotransporter-associated beta strand repeat-containing protein [Planctomycetota bacterium]